jgi:hypothetical protein
VVRDYPYVHNLLLNSLQANKNRGGRKKGTATPFVPLDEQVTFTPIPYDPVAAMASAQQTVSSRMPIPLQAPDQAGTLSRTDFQQQPISQQSFSQPPFSQQQQPSFQAIPQQFPQHQFPQPISRQLSRQPSLQLIPQQPLSQQLLLQPSSQQQPLPEQQLSWQSNQLPSASQEMSFSQQQQSTSQQLLAVPQGIDFHLDSDYPTYDWNYQEPTGDSPLASEPLLLEEDEYSEANITIRPLPSSHFGNWDHMQLPTLQPSVSYPPQRPDQPLEGYTPPSSFTAHNPEFQAEQRMPVMHSISPHASLRQTPSAGGATEPPVDIAELERRLYTPTHTVSSFGTHHHRFSN